MFRDYIGQTWMWLVMPYYPQYLSPTWSCCWFFSEQQYILSYKSTLPHDLMRDFNLCIDSSSSDAGRLSGILDSFDLHQYVDFPTHIHGHSLDLMTSSPGCNVVSVSASDLISDHLSVAASLQTPSNHSRTIPQTIKYWKLQSINMEAFKADIQNSDLIRYPKTNTTEVAQQYNSVLYTLSNFRAPLASKKIFIKLPNPIDRYQRQKSAHHSKIIAEHSGDYGSLWKAFNNVLHRCPKMHLPDYSSIAALANTFISLIINKICVIRSFFPSDSHSRVFSPIPFTRKVLQNLSCVTADVVRHLILRAPSVTSDLDPIPTSLVKDCMTANMISGHVIPHHLYADDSQLYVSFASALNALQYFGLWPVIDVDQ